MPETYVKIEWDKPDDTPGWLCADNIAIALHAYCENTKFKVSEIPHDKMPAEVPAFFKNIGACAARVINASEELKKQMEKVRMLVKQSDLLDEPVGLGPEAVMKLKEVYYAALKDVTFLMNLVPDWAKDVPEGQHETMYGTLSYEGDLKVKDVVDDIRNRWQIKGV